MPQCHRPWWFSSCSSLPWRSRSTSTPSQPAAICPALDPRAQGLSASAQCTFALLLAVVARLMTLPSAGHIAPYRPTPAQVRVAPYKAALLNQLEIMAILVFIVTVWLAVLLSQPVIEPMGEEVRRGRHTHKQQPTQCCRPLLRARIHTASLPAITRRSPADALLTHQLPTQCPSLPGPLECPSLPGAGRLDRDGQHSCTGSAHVLHRKGAPEAPSCDYC